MFMKGSGVCDFTQDDALIFKFFHWLENLTCFCQTDAEKHGRTLTDTQTERWTDEGSERQGDRQIGRRQLPLEMLYWFGKLRDNISLRQFAACLLMPRVYSLCVQEHYHLISLQMEYSCLLVLTSFADTPAHTHTHRFIRLLSLYISPLFLLMLTAKAGTAEYMKLLLDKRLFLWKFAKTLSSNRCPICRYAQPE